MFLCFFTLMRRPPIPTLFPYTTLFRSDVFLAVDRDRAHEAELRGRVDVLPRRRDPVAVGVADVQLGFMRSEEHTSELQSHSDLVCRLLLEKKNVQKSTTATAARFGLCI